MENIKNKTQMKKIKTKKVKTVFAKIFLVRHGQVLNPKHIIYGYLPLPLSPKGRTQIKRAGAVLKKQKIAAIFASPQKRAQESAKIISQIISKGKIKVKIEAGLRESGFGRYTQGATPEMVKKKYAKLVWLYNRQPAKIKAGGEDLAKMAKRLIVTIKKTIKKHPGQNLVFVSHRDPILAALLKISLRDLNDLHKVKAICDTGEICEVWSVGNRLINKTYLAS